MKYLLTPSLHETIRWYRKIEDKSKNEVLDSLRKNKTEPSEAMRKGIDFENHVMAAVNLGVDTFDDPYESCVVEVAEIVKGGLWQERVHKNITIKNNPYLLYGKTDVIKRDWIYDIKFTSNYEVGKYSGSIQHLAYMYCTDIEKFSYLISDGRSVWREDYFWDDSCEEKLFNELTGLIDFIMADEEFKTAYQENWKCKY